LLIALNAFTLADQLTLKLSLPLYNENNTSPRYISAVS